MHECIPMQHPFLISSAHKPLHINHIHINTHTHTHTNKPAYMHTYPCSIRFSCHPPKNRYISIRHPNEQTRVHFCVHCKNFRSTQTRPKLAGSLCYLCMCMCLCVSSKHMCTKDLKQKEYSPWQANGRAQNDILPMK
jgi:hypothetical protein